ncbi:glycosyltransferase [Micromonospora sp. DR5-3]|uniref:glycosyltransferase family 2 protein n=1 Tax=unclassified Micromonospora TaxID=2617518 RepID=UPI0011D4036A|nr:MULTISPECIES: glycosyltransferase [unclassified Micromonospora]MCW3815475.1 glycosyltransferase [Micromonospora sp. DR5-3]TYC24286.1 glycosyltransferase [Micromonospora sp. MP36]
MSSWSSTSLRDHGEELPDRSLTRPLGRQLALPVDRPRVVPTFSVCIVVRDRAVLLVNAVRSVLANNFPDFEVVVVDDGSQVPVTQVMDEAMLSSDARVRVVAQPPTGIAQARNLALRTSTGRYVTVLDSDDELSVDALARLHHLITTTGASWIYTDYREVSGGRSQVIRLPEYATPGRMLLGVLTRPRLPFKHSGTTIDRRVLDHIGGYDESFRLFEDIELVLRALRAGVHPRRLAHPVVQFRRHDGNVTRGRMGGLGFWFRLVDMYRPSRVPGSGLGIKALRTLSEAGKWLVTLGR